LPVRDKSQFRKTDEQVAAKHGARPARSDPDTLIGMAERIPDWSVLVVVSETVEERELWRAAAGRSHAAAWTVHELGLGTTLRTGQWPQQPPSVLRDLAAAKQLLRDRFAADPAARFGILASSRDQDLVYCGVANDPALTGRPGLLGPWCCDGEESRRSGRHLEHVATEFAVRGVELDGALVAWGTDLVRVDGLWTNTYARDYSRRARVRDPLRLRRNAYRLLLSRGLDETVVFVPPRPLLDETAACLAEGGLDSL